MKPESLWCTAGQECFKTRTTNGEVLTESVKTKTSSFKAGRFFLLVPSVCNKHLCDVQEKLPRCSLWLEVWRFEGCPVDSVHCPERVDNYHSRWFRALQRAFWYNRRKLYFIVKPQMVVWVSCMECSVQMASCNPDQNLCFLKFLYRTFVIEDLNKKVIKRPPYYLDSIFIRRVKDADESFHGDILNLPTPPKRSNSHNREINLNLTHQEMSMQDIDRQRCKGCLVKKRVDNMDGQ